MLMYVLQMSQLLVCVGEPSEIEKYHWLNISIKLHNVKLMKELISKGVCVNFPAELPKDAEFSPLHNCVEYNLLEGIPLLVDAGADVDIHARDKHRPCNSTSSCYSCRGAPNGEGTDVTWCRSLLPC